MFQDGYHPQRHGMGPLSDSEFAFSNMKRMHRKKSLLGNLDTTGKFILPLFSFLIFK